MMHHTRDVEHKSHNDLGGRRELRPLARTGYEQPRVPEEGTRSCSLAGRRRVAVPLSIVADARQFLLDEECDKPKIGDRSGSRDGSRTPHGAKTPHDAVVVPMYPPCRNSSRNGSLNPSPVRLRGRKIGLDPRRHPFEEAIDSPLPFKLPSLQCDVPFGSGSSAPPTRAGPECSFPLSPIDLPSPPRTDPAGRRRRFRKLKTPSGAEVSNSRPEIDSPLPFPPGHVLLGNLVSEANDPLVPGCRPRARGRSTSSGEDATAVAGNLRVNLRTASESTATPTAEDAGRIMESCGKTIDSCTTVESNEKPGPMDITSEKQGHGQAMQKRADKKKVSQRFDTTGQEDSNQEPVVEFLEGELIPTRVDGDYWDNSNGSHIFDSLQAFKDDTPQQAVGSRANPNPEASMTGPCEFEESVDPTNTNIVRGNQFVWIRGDLIGRGSLGCVWKALNRNSGQMMAVKEVVIDPKDPSADKYRTALQNEIDLYKDMQHRNICSYLGNDFINSRLYIYLEYMPGGSIAQVISQFGALDEPVIGRYTCDILKGLEYLHTRDPPVLHRDIKGANILVGLDRTAKLTDFGCSKRSEGTAVHTLRGSIPWMAPEVMQEQGYGRKADIWSLGCVIIEMATAAAPWGHFDNCLAAMVRIAMSAETPPVPGHLSDACQRFISCCTRRTPEERPCAADLLTHDFIEGYLNPSAIDESWGDE